MSNAQQAQRPSTGEEGEAESEESSNLRALMMAVRHQQVLEIQEALAGSHRSQQQQQATAAAAAAAGNEAGQTYEAPPTCKPGGYPEEVFIHLSDSDREALDCRICFNILRDCYECRNRHRFCYACIYEWSSQSGQGSNLCPVCRCPGEYARNSPINQQLGRRRVRCTEGPPGRCNWRGCLSDLEGHRHKQYELHEIYTSAELPSLRPERTGDSVVPAGQRLTTTELVRRHSEAKTAAAAAAAATAAVPATPASEAAAASAADAGENTGRLLVRRQQDSARRLTTGNQQAQQQQQTAEPLQQPMEYKRLVRPRPPPPSAAQRLQDSREQLALLMTLLTIQMQERQQAMQMMQLEARRREAERRRQLAEVEALHQRLTQIAADVSRPPPQRLEGQQQQQPQQQPRQQGQQQHQHQSTTPRLPAINRRDSSQGGGGSGISGSRTGGSRS